MLLDIFDQSNSITVNYKAIKIFGLPTAVYITELVTIYRKAYHKNKIDENGYFKVDRKYITDLISLSQEEQLICDLNLIKTSILKKSDEDPNLLKLDFQLYLSLLSDDDVTLIDNVKKQMKTSKPRGVKQSQRQITKNNLKNSIECSNYELLTALREWVEAIYAKPNGYLSKLNIREFQNTLNNYTQGDLDLALRLVQIASIQGYKDCQWAINIYEKDQKYKKLNNSFVPNNNVRTTEQKVATEETLSNIEF